MDSYTTGIIIRSRIEEQHRMAARERLLRTATASTPTHPTWRGRLAVIVHRPLQVADAK